MQNCDQLYSRSIQLQTEDSWREYRAKRNEVSRINKTNKTKYYEKWLNLGEKLPETNGGNINQGEKLNEFDIYSDKKMWKNVRELTNNCKQKPARIISHNNTVISSLKEIVKITN